MSPGDRPLYRSINQNHIRQDKPSTFLDSYLKDQGSVPTRALPRAYLQEDTGFLEAGDSGGVVLPKVVSSSFSISVFSHSGQSGGSSAPGVATKEVQHFLHICSSAMVSPPIRLTHLYKVCIPIFFVNCPRYVLVVLIYGRFRVLSSLVSNCA